VFRNGIPCCTHMLTQCATKAPKWTIPHKPHEPHESDLHPGPEGCPPPDKYPRDVGYTFDRAGPPKKRRPESAPPGPRFVPPSNPTTPRYSFGTTPRSAPFGSYSGARPEEPTPGPLGAAAIPHGPKYSMTARPPPTKAKGGDAPGPGGYIPRPQRPQSAKGPRFVRENPDIVPRFVGPGPNYMPSQEPPGQAFSIRPPIIEKEDDNWRQLGPPYTYFGYNDFGRSDCCNCHDFPNFLDRPTEKAQMNSCCVKPPPARRLGDSGTEHGRSKTQQKNDCCKVTGKDICECKISKKEEVHDCCKSKKEVVAKATMHDVIAKATMHDCCKSKKEVVAKADAKPPRELVRDTYQERIVELRGEEPRHIYKEIISDVQGTLQARRPPGKAPTERRPNSTRRPQTAPAGRGQFKIPEAWVLSQEGVDEECRR